MPSMFQQSQRSDSLRHHSRAALARPTALIAVFAAAACLAAASTGAQTRATPVQFWAAGRLIPLATSAVTSGRDTYVPISALPAIGARGTLGARRDGVSVRLRSGRVDVLPFVRRNGAIMISLTDLAESADGTVIRPSASPAAGLRPNTAYLLAHITDVHVQGNDLRVTTSFPVPFVANNLPGTASRGFVDCVGATISRDFKPVRIPAVERRAERIRIGQFAPDIARVVVDLAPGVSLERISTEGKVTHTFMAALEAGRSSSRIARAPHRSTVDTGTEVLRPSTHRTRGSRTIPEDYSDGSAVPAPEAGRAHRTDDTGATDPPSVRRRPRTADPETAPAARPAVGTRVVEIRGIAYESQDNQSIQLIIETSRRAKAYVRYSATSRQVIIDIPNSRLNLDDERQKEQDIQHPLIEGLSAATVQNSPRLPPLTRITIDAPRIVSTSVEADAKQIVLEITVPKTSRNMRALPRGGRGALVVVDAGHGGILTGAKAVARHHPVYEKDITLAIATNLRAALLARGYRVVMTRSGDVNVALEDRPRIANEVGAQVFVSIHNDSWGKANAITGTTTYYHGRSAASRELARCVERELAGVSGMRDRGAMTDTTMYPVGFCVLRDSTMPAVLCEVGYLNNSADRRKLMNSAYQRRVAEAVSIGIQNFIDRARQTARRHTKRQASAA